MSADNQLIQENLRLRRELEEMKKGAVNYDFVQVSRRHIDHLNELAAAAPSAHKLLWKLIKSMNKQNAVMVSQESLIKLTGLSRRTVQRSVELLREQNWIEVLKIGTANVYRVNSAVVWQSRADGRWASFSAEVLVNFDEQDEITKALPEPKLRHIPFVEPQDEVIVPDASKALEPPPEQPMLDFHKTR
jgi:DNA-binding transcriptional MocR family regulator